MKRLLPLTAIVVILHFAASPASGADAAKVGRYELFEAEFAAQNQPANPYVELTAEAMLMPPAGGQARAVPLFWDGGLPRAQVAADC